MPEVITFQQAIERTNGEDRSLLMGNGFSAQFFSYASLLAQSALEAGSPVRKLFDDLETFDFELVVRSLEDAAIVERSYGNVQHADQLVRDAQSVRESLVHAVKSTHPEYRDELIFQYGSAARFLAHFVSVFSLNYDLLLYWVVLEASNLSDGFGLGEYSDDGRFRGPFKEDAYCDVFYVHGGLHLFQNDVGDIDKALNSGGGVIATIAEQISQRRKMPLYVAEGSSRSKLKRINSVGYLRHCYRNLRENAATVFVYGHSANESDAHIYDAVFRSGSKHVYFGVHKPNDEKVRWFDAQLSRYKKLAGDKVPYTLYASETANVWNAANEGEGKEE